MNGIEIKRLEIWWCDYGELKEENFGKDFITRKKRPCVIVSNNKNNKHSNVVITVPMTGNTDKRPLPTHVYLEAGNGLKKPGIVMCEQFITVNKNQLIEKIGEVPEDKHEWLERSLALAISNIFE